MTTADTRQPQFSFDFGDRDKRPGDHGYVDGSPWVQRIPDGTARFTCGDHLTISGDRYEVQRLGAEHLRTAHGIVLP